MEKYKISGVPITEHGKLVGIITNRDMRFETDLTRQIGDCMTKDSLLLHQKVHLLKRRKQF